MEKFYIETYGCQMNEADSEYMSSILLSLGHEKAGEMGDAGIVLVNTCSIREKAETKVLSFLGRVHPYKKKRKSMILGVCGCVARQEGERLIAKAPHVDMVFGPHQINRLPEFISRVYRNREKVVEVSDRAELERSKDTLIPDGLRALIPVMQGCNNFCSFCVVPHVRGREASRPAAEIIAEIKRLAGGGIKEVMLLGQNVNSYGSDLGMENGFVRLIEATADIDGIERIRFTTSHPKDLTDELIAAFASIEKLCPQMHLPVQSGSDKILKLMNRKYDRKTYLQKVEQLRKVRPDIAITTDIIVGFPCETDDDFAETMSLVRELQYDGAFSFKYSMRPQTKAASMPNQVADDIKQARLEILQELQKEITYGKNRQLEGKVLRVLVENRSKRSRDEFTGRTPCFRIVNFSVGQDLNQDMIGSTVEVIIGRGLKNSLKGELLKVSK